MNYKIKLAACTATAAFALISAPANAESIKLAAGSRLVVNFELPAQPATNNSVWIQPDSLTSFGTLQVTNALFDSQGLIAKDSADTRNFKFFSSPNSYFIQTGEPWVIPFDFSRIAAGGSGFRFELDVVGGTPGAWMTLDTKDFKVYTFGDQGGFPAYYGTVTSVSQVPEPASVVMFMAGLAGLAALRRRRAS